MRSRLVSKSTAWRGTRCNPGSGCRRSASLSSVCPQRHFFLSFEFFCCWVFLSLFFQGMRPDMNSENCIFNPKARDLLSATGGSYSRFQCIIHVSLFPFYFSISIVSSSSELLLHFLHVMAPSSCNGGEPGSSEKSKPTMATDWTGPDHEGRKTQTKGGTQKEKMAKWMVEIFQLHLQNSELNSW